MGRSWRLSRSGKACVAAAALEDGLRGRGMTSQRRGLTLRSDNGLVFGAKAFLAVARRYAIHQEYITCIGNSPGPCRRRVRSRALVLKY